MRKRIASINYYLLSFINKALLIKKLTFESLFSGGITILFMCTGLLLAGFMISRFRPKAWQLVLWDIGIGIIFIGALICFAYVECDSKSIHGLGNLKPDEEYELSYSAL